MKAAAALISCCLTNLCKHKHSVGWTCNVVRRCPISTKQNWHTAVCKSTSGTVQNETAYRYDSESRSCTGGRGPESELLCRSL